MSGCGPRGCGPGGCRPPGLAPPPPPDPEHEEGERSSVAVVGAALASVGAAMLVLGVLDAMGIMRLMGTSPAFLGLCMLLVGGFLVILTRAESTGDEEEPETTAGGLRRVRADPEDVFDTRSPFEGGVAGRVGPRGSTRGRRTVASTSTPTTPAPPTTPATAAAPPEQRALSEATPVTPAASPRAGVNDDGAPPAGAPMTARRRRR